MNEEKEGIVHIIDPRAALARIMMDIFQNARIDNNKNYEIIQAFTCFERKELKENTLNAMADIQEQAENLIKHAERLLSEYPLSIFNDNSHLP